MKRLVNGASLALIAAALAAGICAVIGGAVPGVAILGSFAFYAVLGSAVLSALLLWRGRRLLALGALGAAVLNGAVALPSKLQGAAAVEAPSIKMVVFNVRWSNDKFDDMLKAIAAADPDVIVLNEVYGRNRDGFRPLDLQYPYRVECWRSDNCDTLILSRKELSQQNILSEWNGAQIGVAQATLRIGACPVTLFGVHLNRPWPYHSLASPAAQYKQTTALAGILRSWPGPKILVGDLNATTWTPVVRELAEAVDGRALGGWGGTWPYFLPGFFKLPIDHVIVTQPQITGMRTVLNHAGSDHSPVLVELNMPGCD